MHSSNFEIIIIIYDVMTLYTCSCNHNNYACIYNTNSYPSPESDHIVCDRLVYTCCVHAENEWTPLIWARDCSLGLLNYLMSYIIHVHVVVIDLYMAPLGWGNPFNLSMRLYVQLGSMLGLWLWPDDLLHNSCDRLYMAPLRWGNSYNLGIRFLWIIAGPPLITGH